MRHVAAFAVAFLGCAPAPPPARVAGEQTPERIPDASPPELAEALIVDASPFEAPDGGTADDEVPLPADWVVPPMGGAPQRALPTDPFGEIWHPPPPAPETPKDIERRRLRGSPADLHTPEGPARGYRVYRHCPNYAPGAVVAVIGTGTKDTPQIGWSVSPSRRLSLSEIESEFWAFAKAVQRAAAVSSIHRAYPVGTCFDRPGEVGVGLYLNDWRQVDQAIHNVGSWLAAHDWKGDVILWPQPIPVPSYSK